METLKLLFPQLKTIEERFNSQTSETVVSNFLIFIDKVKKNNFQKALQHLNNSKSFLITDKMIPILKSWLSPI